MRTKASVHTLSGHTNAVATVRCQAAEPQIITGTVDAYQVYHHIVISMHYDCAFEIYSSNTSFLCHTFSYHRM